jgi:hypothetical protein
MAANLALTQQASRTRDDPVLAGLVIRARHGDRRAWDALVDRYALLVWSICRRYRLEAADAQDAAQNVGPDGTLNAGAVSQQDVAQSVFSKLWPPAPTAPAGTPGAPGSDGRVSGQPRSGQPQGSGARPDSCDPSGLTMAYLVRGTG